MSGFSDQGFSFSFSITALLDVSLKSQPKKKNLKYNKIVFYLLTCHQNLLLFLELLQFGHISAGNKIRNVNTELSLATIYIFIVAMVTILLAFHLYLPSSSPPQSLCHSPSSSAPEKNRRQKVGDS